LGVLVLLKTSAKTWFYQATEQSICIVCLKTYIRILLMSINKILTIWECAYGMLELLSWGSLPLQMAVALGLLYMQVKFAFLAGLAVIILLIPGGWVCSPSLSAGQSVSSDGFWISEVFLHEGRSWSVS
jgi:hypothetical protein